MKRIVLTGGGTAGHVTPNLALIPVLLKDGWDIHYIGTMDGIEHQLISRVPNVTYHGIKSGKLRRYMDIKNFTDPFRVIAGVCQSISIIHKLKPAVIFSKGGFVSVPVVIGGWFNRIPVVIHESDFTPGLANKISAKFAKKVCTTFPETVKYLPEQKGIYTGTPIRPELLNGDLVKGRSICGFDQTKPVVLVMGGSLGATAINKAVRDNIDSLTRNFYIAHICGKNNIDSTLLNHSGYKQFEYISDELPHVMAMSDIVVSRAGANSIYEFLVLKKPALLIPLPLKASRGDQILNAKSFEKQGFSKVLPQEEINRDTFMNAILDLYKNRNKYIDAMTKNNPGNSINQVLDIIKNEINNKNK